jgi:signal peptidase I
MNNRKKTDHSKNTVPAVPEAGPQTDANAGGGFMLEARKNIVSLGVMLAIVFGIKEMVVGSYRIPSESMVPTLMVGDLLFTWNLSYGVRLPFEFDSFLQWGIPSRNDVVVFRRDDDPRTTEDETAINIVKRVIGLPGETIEVRGTTVLINGNKLDETRPIWGQGGWADFGPVTVPEGHVVVLGDNRDFSKDSRFWGNGPFLPIKNIRGRAFFIYFSFNKFSRMGTVIR